MLVNNGMGQLWPLCEHETGRKGQCPLRTTDRHLSLTLQLPSGLDGHSLTGPG
jgi:hypothetical protein